MLDRFSIRARLTAAFAIAMLVILSLAGAFVYERVGSDLSEALDERLRARSDDVSAIVSNAIDRPATLRLEAQTRFLEGEETFAQVLDPGGGPAGEVTPDDREVVASTLAPSAAPVLSAEEVEQAALAPVVIEEREVPGIEGEARLLARPATAFDRLYVIVVGASTEDREEALAGLLGAFAIGAPIALLLASGLSYLLAGRALAPVDAMRRRAAEITLDRSGERLPLPRADDEIRHLGETLNAMLDRIEASLEREREFVADAGHELRTPLAILRAELELAEREGRTPAELRAAIASAGDEADRLSQLAEDLLVIARADQGRLPIKREPTDLRELLRRVSDRFARRAAEAGREIEVEAPDGAQAELDPLRMEQALGNLVDNALRHGAGAIRIAAVVDSDRLRLVVCDEGAGFPRGFRERAFERFSRADEGRTGGGAGLGLAIVRAIAEAHGGAAHVDGVGVEIAVPAEASGPD